jgi:Family of unknown function (DUF6459)
MTTTSPSPVRVALSTPVTGPGVTRPPRPGFRPTARSTARPGATGHALHRLPVCDPQPPFDDELLQTAGTTQPIKPILTPAPRQHALTLAFAFPGGLPAVPDLPDALRQDADRPTRPISLSRTIGDDEFGPQPTPRAQLPEPTPWAGRLVQGLLEVLVGVRPASQLVRWTTTEVYDSVQRRLTRASVETRTGQARRLAEVVRSVHVSEPADGVAEICAVVAQGPRCRAVAMRLEGVDGRWQCTALQIG